MKNYLIFGAIIIISILFLIAFNEFNSIDSSGKILNNTTCVNRNGKYSVGQYTRNYFKEKFLGKTKDYLLEKLGEPDEINKLHSGSEWIYHCAVKDSIFFGKIDFFTYLIIDDNHVDGIKFAN